MSTSGRDDYRTPRWMFENVNKEFGFTFDLAADADNHLVDYWFGGPCKGVGDDCGLCVEIERNTIWCNPPYSDLTPWVKRFGVLAERNTVVALLPVDPTTKWWTILVNHAHELRFTYKRVNFDHAPNCDCESCEAGKKPTGNNKGSVFAVYRPGLKPVSPVIHWGWWP